MNGRPLATLLIAMSSYAIIGGVILRRVSKPFQGDRTVTARDIVSNVRAVLRRTVLRMTIAGAGAMLGAVAAPAQDFEHVEVQLLAKGLHFADGPVWSYEGFLIFSDAPVDRMHKWVPGTGDTEAGRNRAVLWPDVRYRRPLVYVRISRTSRDARGQERQSRRHCGAF